jgi:hypothetical protein
VSDGQPSSVRGRIRGQGEPRGRVVVELTPADAVRALQAEHALSERQARRYVNAARATPDGVMVPERTVVFTVRLAPSLIAGLRCHSRSRGQSLSATVAEAVGLYLDHVHERPVSKAR